MSSTNNSWKGILWNPPRKTKKGLSANTQICVVLILLSSLINVAFAKDPVPINFAFSNSDPPTSYLDQQGQLKGILPELVLLAFDSLPDYNLTMKAFPWRRAKANVKENQMDGLITYPSEPLTQHMRFTDQAIYLIDYGYIIYSKNSTHASTLDSIKTEKGLKDLVLISDSSPGFKSWEEVNLPPNVFRRIYAKNIKIAFHLLFLRNAGDYLIRNPEEAISIAKELGYQDLIRIRKIELPSLNVIPFHIGIRKSHLESEKLIVSLNQLLQSDDFQQKSKQLILTYQKVK
ncbi:hypothetical protein [Alkalimarinus coralli]|uniref:hypothetical protein n=1 Tax=Alkalimarinus coralli TaxID=2935863 RepID=UPI00202B854C|nr:hypothetical protein [Alkalimarinus coralli]